MYTCIVLQGLLGNLKDSINDHQKYIDNCRKFQEFLSTCYIKLQECKDTTGEKAAIVSRVSILKVSTCFSLFLGAYRYLCLIIESNRSQVKFTF